MPLPDDHELMQQIAAGIPEAFDTLVCRWQPRLSRTIARWLGLPTARGAEIDDLCQEVFVKVYLFRGRYYPNFAFSTWLYRIALNVVRDAARRKRRWRLSVEWLAANTSEPTPATQAADDEARIQIRSAVARLPEKIREAIVLKHFGELTFAEVAEVLEIPISTAKSRVELGLITLRKLLRETDDPPQSKPESQVP